MMSALIADQLSFGWSPDELLFESISVAIHRERVAVVGQNGIGKSTLIEVLAGEREPFRGHVLRPETWLYLPQVPDLTQSIEQALGIEDKLSALRRFEDGTAQGADYDLLENNWDIEDQAIDILRDFDLSSRAWTDLISSLSGGQSMRVRLARAELQKPELLILDEPTNNLDADGLRRLDQFVEAWPSSLLVVSHDPSLLSKMDRILELSTHGLTSYGGNFDFYRQAKSQERESAQRRLMDAQKRLKHARRDAQVRKERTERRAALGKRTKVGSLPPVVIGNLKRRAESAAGKSQGVGERQVSEAIDQLDQAREGIEIRDPLAFDIRSTGLSPKKRVLSVEDLTVQYAPDTVRVLDKLSFDLIGPERVAINGKNGSGKSTLFKAIIGKIPSNAGRVSICVERYAFLSQDASRKACDQSLIERFFEANPDVSENEARAALARFGFRNTTVEASLTHLSGGERLRAALAISLMSAFPPQLIILDEPTNHMDLESIETLERALNGYDGALIVASHDRWFLNAIGVTREIEL